MVKRLSITVLASLAVSGAAFAQIAPTADTPKSTTGRTAADCEKLSSAARDVCMRDLQADSKAQQPSTGGTAGSGSSSTGGGAASQTAQLRWSVKRRIRQVAALAPRSHRKQGLSAIADSLDRRRM
jgi:hypothetical protein